MELLKNWTNDQVSKGRFKSVAAAQEHLAKELDTCASHVRMMAYGVRSVPYKYHRKLNKLTRIPFADFEATHTTNKV